MRSKRSISLLPAFLLSASALVGCNSILGLNEFSLGDAGPSIDGPIGPGADVRPDGYVGECDTNAECTDRATAIAIDAGTLPTGDAGLREMPAVCIKPEHRCVNLLTEDCTEVFGDYRDNDAIILGTLFSLVGAQRAMNLERQRSATLAAEQINAVGGIPAPGSGGNRQKLLMVSCNEAATASAPGTTVLLRAGKHLIEDLHVPAIVGPNTSQDTLDLSNQMSVSAGTLLLTPSAVASGIAELMDNDLTWLSVPSDLQRGPLMINQINQLETELKAARNKDAVKLGIVYRNDAVGTGTFGSLKPLVINGTGLGDPANVALVSIDSYQLSAPNQEALVNRYLEWKPDIIVLAGLAEVITTIMNPMEERWPAGADKPHYVLTDQVKGPDLRSSTSRVDLRPRVRGTGLTPVPDSMAVTRAFELDYRGKYGEYPTASGAGPSYDATFAIAYALSATRDLPVSGATIAKGLRKLGGAMGNAIPVGQSNVLATFSRLATGENVNVQGTYLPLEWDERGAVVNGNIEIWCVALPAGATMTAYFSSKLTYDIKTGMPSGSYEACTK
jgi:ABC-type branched-subunit amino acid transport system substrate-binding protein